MHGLLTWPSLPLFPLCSRDEDTPFLSLGQGVPLPADVINAGAGALEAALGRRCGLSISAKTMWGAMDGMSPSA